MCTEMDELQWKALYSQGNTANGAGTCPRRASWKKGRPDWRQDGLIAEARSAISLLEEPRISAMPLLRRNGTVAHACRPAHLVRGLA